MSSGASESDYDDEENDEGGMMDYEIPTRMKSYDADLDYLAAPQMMVREESLRE